MEKLFSELPSTGYGLNVSELQTDKIIMRPFAIEEMMLLSESLELDSPSKLIDAVGDTLNINVNVLSVGDFYTLLAMQRCAVFEDSPISLAWRCINTVYKDTEGNVFLGEDLGEDLEVVVEPVECEAINTKEFTFEDFEKITVSNLELLGDDFDLPRVAHLAEYLELMREPRYKHVLPIARWIKEGNSMTEKLAILADKGMSLFDQLSKVNSIVIHGVNRSLVASCSICGSRVQQPLHLDASSFFRD